jgi:hypothetical protein
MLFVYEDDAGVGRAKWRYVTTGRENDQLVEIVPSEEGTVEPARSCSWTGTTTSRTTRPCGSSTTSRRREEAGAMRRTATALALLATAVAAAAASPRPVHAQQGDTLVVGLDEALDNRAPQQSRLPPRGGTTST